MTYNYYIISYAIYCTMTLIIYYIITYEHIIQHIMEDDDMAGRKYKADADIKKRVTICMNAATKAIVTEAAADAQTSVSDYIAQLIHKDAERRSRAARRAAEAR